MFTKPLSEIEFTDIEDFCRTYPEGVRTEYKQDVPASPGIPKSVSSFANTLGGIMLIGVETDNKNFAILPIEGKQNDRGLEERIVESAFTGIYPPVTPEVRVFDVPRNADKVVVIVRVDESVQAPHAIQNSTKVYIRVGSTSQLADIDRIEYLLTRRKRPQALCEQILNRIEERVNGHSSYSSFIYPYITLIARPTFPYRPLISPSAIYDYLLRDAPTRRVPLRFVPAHSELGVRKVAGGACLFGADSHHQELNEHGIVFQRMLLNRLPVKTISGHEDDDKVRHFTLEELVGNHRDLTAIAGDFYRTCQYLGNIEITTRLDDVGRLSLRLGWESKTMQIKEQQSLDSVISASTQCLAHDLFDRDKSTKVIVDLLTQILWGFNVNEDVWKKNVRRF